MMESIHRKVQVWIFSSRGAPWFLLLKTTKERGAFWQPVTGGVEEGETFTQAALREAHEETGFVFRAETLIDLNYEFTFNRPSVGERAGGQFLERCFALPLQIKADKSLPAPRLDSREHENYKWVSKQEAMDNLRHPSNAESLKKLIQRIE